MRRAIVVGVASLVALRANPAYARAATADIDRVDDNRRWFRDYRTEALKAIGH